MTDESTTKRPSDAELVTLLRAAGDELAYMARMNDAKDGEANPSHQDATGNRYYAAADALKAASAESTREQELRAALMPFAHFYRQWCRRPIGTMNDDHALYTIHSGCAEEAEITLGDLKRAARAEGK